MSAPQILRSDPDLSGSLQPFRERLAETVSWCGRRAGAGSLGEILRTPALAPPPASPWPETVHVVAEQRLLQLGRSWKRSLDPLGGGHLLVYFPGGRSGAAQQASGGYCDGRDTPPWDTWVAFVEETGRSYLVAWVPPAGIAPVGAAIEAAP
ncbi:MAG TPA: hypothetical protein VNH46_10670, partial [Gemmatimonadales bacterium]|nr:hypothetical protein [Gemmatimonadales bacterium]